MEEETLTYTFPATALLVEVMTECGYTPYQMARYLNVPRATFANWLSERREMPPCAERLLELLTFLRRFAPAIHVQFEPPPALPDGRRRENHPKRTPTTRPRKPVAMRQPTRVQ